MNAEAAQAAVSLLERGESFAWVTILDSHGSSPRHAGAAMLVRPDGSPVGTIGGGPLEADFIRRALEAINTGRSSLERFDSAELGMTCGGSGLVLVEHVGSSRSGLHELFRSLAGLLESGDRGWLVTAVPEGDLSSSRDLAVFRCLVHSGGAIVGDPVDAPERLRALAERGGVHHRIISEGTKATEGPMRIYIHSVGARGSVYVFGAGHCGEKLIPVLSMLGFFTVVVDDRADFANRERFPAADQIVVPESFDGVVPSLPIDEDSYVVIVTRGHAEDKSVLRQALSTSAGYIGMIGSKRKVAEAFRTLGEEGFTAADLARVHAPIGLPIGAETTEEIAISIAAQLIQVRSAKGQ